MSVTRTWDQAGSLPVPASGPARPEIVALRGGLPDVPELFTFMRDAELRFETLRMTVEEHSWTARGEEVVVSDVALRHPGVAKVLVSRPGASLAASYEVWASDGETVSTYTASRKLGTRRPARGVVRGTANPDLPGSSRVYLSVTPLLMESLPELFIHPAGFCQNILATGSCEIIGLTSVAGREAIALECRAPRTTELAGERQDFVIRIAVDRLDGVILHLEESLGGQVTRDAVVTSYRPNAQLGPADLAFSFPGDTTFIY